MTPDSPGFSCCIAASAVVDALPLTPAATLAAAAGGGAALAAALAALPAEPPPPPAPKASSVSACFASRARLRRAAQWSSCICARQKPGMTSRKQATSAAAPLRAYRASRPRHAALSHLCRSLPERGAPSAGLSCPTVSGFSSQLARSRRVDGPRPQRCGAARCGGRAGRGGRHSRVDPGSGAQRAHASRARLALRCARRGRAFGPLRPAAPCEPHVR